MHPVVRNNRIVVRASGVTSKQKSRMRVREHLAVQTLVECRLTENSRLEIPGVWRDVGFPAQARDHCQAGCRLPRVLQVEAYVTFARIPTRILTLPELGRPPQHEITHGQSGVRGIEIEQTGRLCAGHIVAPASGNPRVGKCSSPPYRSTRKSRL